MIERRFDGLPVVVAGARAAGGSVTRALLGMGALVTVTDRPGNPGLAELAELGARPVVDLASPEPGTGLVVTSPGFKPDHPLLVAARDAGVPVIGDVELAWEVARSRGRPAPWLAVTGTNGKTTTVRMLAAILTAAGANAVAAGNVGLPVIDAVLADQPYDVLAVELSSFQLYWAPSPRPLAGAVLNVVPDHLDWHGTFDAYAECKARVFHPGGINVYNRDDPGASALAEGLPNSVPITLSEPDPGSFGVVDGFLVDRTGVEPVRLAAVDVVRPPGPHNVTDALTAAALARAYGVPPAAVAAGLRAFVPDQHRNSTVAEVGGVRYVDDSKATNPHAAGASLSAYRNVVWIAGGQLKGADVNDLVAANRDRFDGVVLIGADRALIRAAFARHAQDVPMVEVDRADDGAMTEIVRVATGLARSGGTVLLAPAAASFDMFRDYQARGDAFAAAVAELAGPA